jgi:hypothetical protein
MASAPASWFSGRPVSREMFLVLVIFGFPILARQT